MAGAFIEIGQRLNGQLGQILAAQVPDRDDDPIGVVRAVHDIRDGAEELMDAAVQRARGAGRTWQEIGDVLGVSREVAQQRYGGPLEPQNAKITTVDPLAGATGLARTVIDDHARGRWADVTARFDDTMRAGLTEEGLAEAWSYLIGLAGAYEGHGNTDTVRVGAFTVTNTPLAFEAGEFVARITFRDDSTIAGLFILSPEAASGASS